MNKQQETFFRNLADIQESSVQACLAKNGINDSVAESLLYEVTFSVITEILTMIDGDSGFSNDKHDIVNMVTGQRLKENPCIELHDEVEEYLKYE